MSRYLALDLGAESGRAMLGTISENGININEIHRFRNIQIEDRGHIHWDVEYLRAELKTSFKKVVDTGINVLEGAAIDTWGVDYGIIGKDGNILGSPFAYRDHRTDGIMEKIFEIIPKNELYFLTGIQFMQFNTLFQLYSHFEQDRELRNNAGHLLHMPDLFNYFLCGEIVSEYTIASTSQILNVHNKIWEKKIITRLDLPFDILPRVIQPGIVIGKLQSEISRETGMHTVDIIASASHDTASAVAAVPSGTDNMAYISSGTWSLVGIETDTPIVDEQSLKNNFTNEGGVEGKIRFLKNTMGLWLLQGCMRIWSEDDQLLTYAGLVKLAEKAEPFTSIIDPDHQNFLNPPDMEEAIADFCRKTGQPVPGTIGEFSRCILESLAFKYSLIIKQINSITGKKIDSIHVVGGGSQNYLLNQFTSDATGLPVSAGPVEATALGNIIVQAAAKGEISGIEEGRKLIAQSFSQKHFEPGETGRWAEKYRKIRNIYSL